MLIFGNLKQATTAATTTKKKNIITKILHHFSYFAIIHNNYMKWNPLFNSIKFIIKALS